jgi:hypothetical protein
MYVLPLDSHGNAIPVHQMVKTVTTNGSGQVISVSVTDGTSTWTQTIAYPSGTSTTVSPWVKS